MTVHSFAHSGQENMLNYKRSHNREASRIIKSWRLLLPHMTSKTSDKYIATFAQPAKTTCKSDFPLQSTCPVSSSQLSLSTMEHTIGYEPDKTMKKDRRHVTEYSQNIAAVSKKQLHFVHLTIYSQDTNDTGRNARGSPAAISFFVSILLDNL